ncbi:MAG: caspase family protein [Candidatus Wallbacteria bacterium]|nr:caspase family protein [Candidatus Wallbacteria bacterium]
MKSAFTRFCSRLGSVALLALTLLAAAAPVGARPLRCATDGQTQDASDVRLARLPAPAGGAGHYALILNGDAGKHHVQNCIDAYAALRANGFTDDDIFLLSNEPRVGSANVPTLGHNDGPPSTRNLAAVFRYLREQVGPADTLVVYVTGHGGYDGGKDPHCFIEIAPREKNKKVCSSGQLALDSFVAGVSAIHPRRGLFVFDQCFGHAFASTLADNGSFVSIALSTKPEEVFCQNFSPFFWSELRKSGQLRKPLPRRSVKAAYERAAKIARKKEKTQRPEMKLGPGVDPAKFFLWE